MKTNVILFLATLLFATSCSNKFSLVKRKYNKGFYVSVNKKAAAPKPVERNDVKQNTAGDKVAVQVVPANNNTSYVPVTNVKPAAVVSDNSAPKSTGSKHD